MTRDFSSSTSCHKDRVINRSIVFVGKSPLERNHTLLSKKDIGVNLLEFRRPQRGEASRFVLGSIAAPATTSKQATLYFVPAEMQSSSLVLEST